MSEHGQPDSERDFVLTAISHRLRTPVTVLHGLLQLRASSGPMDPKAARDIEDTLLRQARHLVRIVDDLTDVTALTMAAPPKPHMVSVHALLEDSIARVADRHLLVDGVDQVDLDCPTGLMAELDPTLVVLCLAHVVANAVIHGAPPITIRADGSLDADDEARGTVTLTVTDRGPGLPTHVDVFAPMSWGSPDGPDPGLGVGLAIVARRVAAMGGSVEATSRPDFDGTRVDITLPVSRLQWRPVQGGPHVTQALDRATTRD